MTLTITTGKNGRLGNQIIRNLAVSFIAKEHDLFVKYFNYDLIKKLGIDLHIGNKVYKKIIKLTENNYFDILLKEEIDYNLNPNYSYFQTQNISDLIFQHLNSLEVKNNIIFNNPFNVRYQNNNDVFLHIRLTDASKYNPGAEYYLHCLSKLNFDNIYIATDDPNNIIIKKILNKYPLSNLYLKNEIETIQFGSTCKYIILSHGSFSAIIGYLSFFSNVLYLNTKPSWCPLDLYINRGWNAIEPEEINKF